MEHERVAFDVDKNEVSRAWTFILCMLMWWFLYNLTASKTLKYLFDT